MNAIGIGIVMFIVGFLIGFTMTTLVFMFDKEVEQ